MARIAELMIGIETARFIVKRQERVKELCESQNDLLKRIRELQRELKGLEKERKTILQDIQETLYSDLSSQIKQAVKNDDQRANQPPFADLVAVNNDEDELLLNDGE